MAGLVSGQNHVRIGKASACCCSIDRCQWLRDSRWYNSTTSSHRPQLFFSNFVVQLVSSVCTFLLGPLVLKGIAWHSVTLLLASWMHGLSCIQRDITCSSRSTCVQWMSGVSYTVQKSIYVFFLWNVFVAYVEHIRHKRQRCMHLPPCERVWRFPWVIGHGPLVFALCTTRFASVSWQHHPWQWWLAS